MFSILTYGLSVAVVGMATVFLGLVILIGLIKGMEKTLNRIKEGGNPLTAMKTGAKAANAPAIVIQTCEVNNNEVVAAIAAAIATVLEAECKESKEKKTFVVRSIRRVSNAPAWNRAGREEQVYSRL